MILAFDHSVENKGGYDFSIPGNQFEGSNEPGVVWVMQDVNGNGKPDDEWYELRGSETGGEWTVQEYAVTYYRPAGPRQGVKWTDNLGRSGQVAYLGQFHAQDYYYPLWLEEESHTYYGTGLRQNTTQTPRRRLVEQLVRMGVRRQRGQRQSGIFVQNRQDLVQDQQRHDARRTARRIALH